MEHGVRFDNVLVVFYPHGLVAPQDFMLQIIHPALDFEGHGRGDGPIRSRLLFILHPFGTVKLNMVIIQSRHDITLE